MKERAKNLLVTGGAGFIGSHFIHYWQHKWPDTRIINLDKLTYAADLQRLSDVDRSNYFFIHGDICDSELVTKSLKDHQIDTIVNFAAESHVDNSIHDPEIFYQTNVAGTINLMRCAMAYWQNENRILANACRFHQVSTDEVYGSFNLSDAGAKEGAPFNPSSPYAASKAGADLAVKAFNKTYGLPTSISHCSNNYGLGQHPEKLIPKVIKACFSGEKIPLYGDGQQWRDWLHVNDHCSALEKIISAGSVGESYHISAHNPVTNSELVELLCQKIALFTGKNHLAQIETVTDRPGHDSGYKLDSQKIKQALNWEASQDFTQGLTQIILAAKNSSCYDAGSLIFD